MPTFEAAGSFDMTFPTAGTPQTTAFDSGSGSNRFMALLAKCRDISVTTWANGGMLYNGVTLTPFGAQFGEACRGYYLIAPASGSNTLSADMDQGFPTDVQGIISVLVYSGVDQVTPFDDYGTGIGSDHTAEMTVTSQVGDTPVIMAGFREFFATTHSPTNYVERFSNVFGDSSATGGEGTGASSVAMVATSDEAASHSWAAIKFNLNQVAAAAASLPPFAPHHHRFQHLIIR